MINNRAAEFVPFCCFVVSSTNCKIMSAVTRLIELIEGDIIHVFTFTIVRGHVKKSFVYIGHQDLL